MEGWIVHLEYGPGRMRDRKLKKIMVKLSTSTPEGGYLTISPKDSDKNLEEMPYVEVIVE